MLKKIRAVYYVRDSYTRQHCLAMLDMAKKRAILNPLRVYVLDNKGKSTICQIEGDVFSRVKPIACMKAAIASKYLDIKYSFALKCIRD